MKEKTIEKIIKEYDSKETNIPKENSKEGKKLLQTIKEESLPKEKNAE